MFPFFRVDAGVEEKKSHLQFQIDFHDRRSYTEKLRGEKSIKRFHPGLLSLVHTCFFFFHFSVRNLVPGEQDIVPDSGFSS